MKLITPLGKVILIFGALVIFLISIWCLDTSVSALMSPGFVTTNGFIDHQPAQTYHLGLATIISLFSITALVLVYNVLRGEGIK
jgi:hypothetical protein